MILKVKYHNELRSKVEIENQIIELHDDLTNFENDLAYLYQPFPNLLELAKKNISIKLLLSEQDNETPKTPTTKYIFGIF